MNKDLYRTTVNRKKEILFYVATFGGRKDVSLVIATKEPIYWRVREGDGLLSKAGIVSGLFTEERFR